MGLIQVGGISFKVCTSYSTFCAPTHPTQNIIASNSSIPSKMVFIPGNLFYDDNNFFSRAKMRQIAKKNTM